jgi:cholesterol transport system auxiliary component
MKRLPAVGLAALLAAACAPLQPSDTPSTYVLDARPLPGGRAPGRDAVIAVGAPRARPGFDTAQMAYVRRAHEIEYFANNRWADTPARMLAPLAAQALDQAGGFRAVVQAPGSAPADLRLDIEVVSLLQDFRDRPSRVRFALRVQLLDLGARRVIATGEFEETEAAPSEDAYGGVVAANRALERLLRRVVDFSAGQGARR